MFSNRLRVARKNKNLSQEELAKLVNTTKASISNYENCHSSPPNDMLLKLANVLGTSADFLLGITDQFHPNSKLSTIPLEKIGSSDIVVTYKDKTMSKRKVQKILKMIELMVDEEDPSEAVGLVSFYKLANKIVQAFEDNGIPEEKAVQTLDSMREDLWGKKAKSS